VSLTIRALGDWAGARLSDIEAVASSAAASFEALGDDEALDFVLEPTPDEDDPPIALSTLSPCGAFVVRLNVRGNLWARLAFQFAHEFCHVLADTRTWTLDRFAWIEEALCETGSLFALRAMSKTWAVAPPYPTWQAYAVELERYATDRLADPAHSLAVGVKFPEWLGDRLPLLEADSRRRADNTIIARQLLHIFEADARRWRALRHLHSWQRPSAGQLADFMKGWSQACAPEHRGVIEAISAVVGVSDA
jgi:hypothetical protein